MNVLLVNGSPPPRHAGNCAKNNATKSTPFIDPIISSEVFYGL
jgi:hypothetical protein